MVAGTTDRYTERRSVSELVERASDQLSTLVRQEMALARWELTEKGRRAGRGGGLLGAAGATAYVGYIVLAGAATAGLSLVLPVWAAALIVAGVLFAAAAVLGALGRRELKRVAPPLPQEAMAGLRTDVQEIKGRAHP